MHVELFERFAAYYRHGSYCGHFSGELLILLTFDSIVLVFMQISFKGQIHWSSGAQSNQLLKKLRRATSGTVHYTKCSKWDIFSASEWDPGNMYPISRNNN